MAGSGTAHLRDDDDVVLRVEDLVVEFPSRHGAVQAVSGVSFDIKKGETLGLVGESGCGKSTTGRAVTQLIRPKSGRVIFEGEELTGLHGEELRRRRTRLQMIFQDPISSLNPRRKIKDVVAEGLDIWGDGDADRDKKVRDMLEAVGLDYDTASERRPHQFSGGQCQRIAIARALVLNPAVIICDEPVSALDVSVQAQILNQLDDLKDQFGVTLLFIAHDLAVVKHISDRVAVMYLGKTCEVATSDDLYAQPAHPYTQALMGAIPIPNPDISFDEVPALGGEIPSPVNPPSGCRFRTRCDRATEQCTDFEPEMREVAPDHFVACHHPLIGEHLTIGVKP